MKRKFKVGDYVILDAPRRSKGVIIDGKKYPKSTKVHKVRFDSFGSEFHYHEDVLIHDTQRYREERLNKLLEKL